MKKISLVVLDNVRVESLRKLRTMGLIHIEQNSGESEELSLLIEQKNLLERSFLLLPLEVTAKDQKTGIDIGQSLDLAQKAVEYTERIREIHENTERLQREAERLKPWGDFDPDEIKNLQKKGLFLKLYELSSEQFKKFPKDISHFIINKTKSFVRLVVTCFVDESDESIKGFEELPLPERGISQVQQIIKQEQKALKKADDELKSLAEQRPQFVSGLKQIEQKIEFEQVRIGMGVDEKIAYLTGYIPVKKVNALKKAGSENGWGLLIDDPGYDDPVPTLVENPRWIQIIQPVFNLLGTVPGYHEADISFWFLLFFSLFFAMLIGDAGYGLIFLGLTFFMGIKSKWQPAVFLLLVLSICTIAWGALTGTWFGAEVFARNKFLSRVIIPDIASFGVDNAGTLMILCFIIGAIHLSLAHLTNFFRFMPHLKAFADLGWLSVLWGMFFVIKFIVLQLPFNQIGLYLIAGGLGLVVIFGEQKGKFFKGMLLGLANLPLKLLDSVSAFSDIISYVRLFAVGLASVEVAKSFNVMASGIGFVMPIGLVTALILFFGHALNIMMGALAVIVHGVRLNMLEFSGHLSMEWTGIPYQPFSDKGE